MQLLKRSLFLTMIGLMLFLSSCSSSKSYADRKRSKYSKSSHVAKSSPKRQRTYKSPKVTKAAEGVRADIVSTAKKYLGKKYVYGGKTPQGFDCSGFTTYVYQANGIHLTGSSQQQARLGDPLTKSQLQTGDLIFFGKGKVSHVGIVVSNERGQLEVIHSTSSRGVVVDNITGSDYWQSRYLYGRDVIVGGYVSK